MGVKMQSMMFLISNALCWSPESATALVHACEHLRITVLFYLQKLVNVFFVGKNLVTAQAQLPLYSNQQREFRISNICNFMQLYFYVLYKSGKRGPFSVAWRKKESLGADTWFKKRGFVDRQMISNNIWACPHPWEVIISYLSEIPPGVVKIYDLT